MQEEEEAKVSLYENDDLGGLEGKNDDLGEIEEVSNNDLEVCNELSGYFYGELKYIRGGKAKIIFTPTQKFIADKHKMIHSGIIDSAGHFCALAAINKPNAVVSRTKSEFLMPIKKDMALEFEASSNYNSVSSKSVKVVGRHRAMVVYESIIDVLVLPEHPFEDTIIGNNNE